MLTLLKFPLILLFPLIMLILTGLILIGCSTDNRSLNPITRKQPSDVSLGNGADGTYVNFTRPNILQQYQAFYVEPITVMNEDGGRMTVSSAQESQNLASSFRSKIIRALGSRHTHFNQPASHVAIIRVKVLDVWSTRALEALRPGLLIPNNLGGGATMEAQFIDSVSGKEFGRVWDSRPGERTGFFQGVTKWGGTKAAFDEWAYLLDDSLGSDSVS